MLVISDTSPILNLAAVGRVDLLRSLYGALIVPPAVQEELASLAMRYPYFSSAMPLPTFVQVKRVPRNPEVDALGAELALRLHPGEAEAIVLAAGIHADLLLVDELPARRLANLHGIRTQGLLGVLVESKRCGLLSSVAPLLDKLRRMLAFGLAETCVSGCWNWWARLSEDNSVSRDSPPGNANLRIGILCSAS